MCQKCQKHFESFNIAKKHVDTVCDPKKYFKCSNCDYKTTRTDLLSKHIRQYHSETSSKKVKRLSVYDNGRKFLKVFFK